MFICLMEVLHRIFNKDLIVDWVDDEDSFGKVIQLFFRNRS